MLQNWASCLADSDQLGKTRGEHLKSKLAKEGSKHLRLLEDTNFFVTYANFNSKFLEISEQLDLYVIGMDECLKSSVKDYFKKHFKNEGLNIDFIPKPHTGAQVG